MAAISEAENKRFKATTMHAKLGFQLQMVINFDSDVAKQAFLIGKNRSSTTLTPAPRRSRK